MVIFYTAFGLSPLALIQKRRALKALLILYNVSAFAPQAELIAMSAAKSAGRRAGKLTASTAAFAFLAATGLAVEDIQAIAEVNHKVRVDGIGPRIAPHLSCDAPTHVALLM